MRIRPGVEMCKFIRWRLTQRVAAGCAAIAATIAIAMTAHADPALWNAAFTRDAVAGGRGWTGGDAAVSVPLPDGDDALWIFGDSLVTDWDLDLNERVYGPFPLAEIVFGNVLAVQTGASSPDADAIRFHARRPGDGSVDDISRDTLGRREALFDYPMAGHPDPGTNTLIWPQGAACLRCDERNASIALAFKEVENCDPSVGPADCIPLCEVTGAGADATEVCTFGVRVVKQILARVDNPRDAVDDWRADAIATRPRDVSWGTDFLEMHGIVIIYGARERDGVIDAVVAVSRPEDLLEMDAWWVYTNIGWRPGSQIGETTEIGGIAPAVIAEDVGALFTVDKIRRRGQTRFLLSHTHPSGDNLAFLRLSRNPLFWPQADEQTPRIDLRSFDPTLERVAQDWLDRGACESVVVNGVADESGCGITYHVQVHRHLSDWDAFGPANLIYSYIVPMGPQDGNNSADYYRPRFGEIPLDLVAPWCAASSSACWQGLNHFYPDQRLDNGQLFAVPIDVSAADTVVLSLESHAGEIEVVVHFGLGQGNGGGNARACLPREDAGTSFDCTIAVPDGESAARVEVRAASLSRFDLRVSHDSRQGLGDPAGPIVAAGSQTPSPPPTLQRGLQAIRLKRAAISQSQEQNEAGRPSP